MTVQLYKGIIFEVILYSLCFHFLVKGYQSNSDGYAEFSVDLPHNAPPALGSCVVTPDEGYALQTDFTVACSGFTDVDEPLTYQIILFSRVDVVDWMFVGRGEGTFLK